MMNRIYFFTGTGNSLKVAEDIAKVLSSCELVAIHRGMDTEIPGNFERIGFVFSVYFWGLPAMVSDFLRNAHFYEQGSTYFFAVATYAGMVGNAIRMTSTLLLEKGVHLNNSAGISMSKRVDKITEESDKKVLSIANNVENKKTKKYIPLIDLSMEHT